MKKAFLLLPILLLSNVLAFSQEVYYAGYSLSEGHKTACVYQNETLLYSIGNPTEDHEASALTISPFNHDVYWVDNRYPSGSQVFGDVYKNGQLYLENEADTKINRLCLHDEDDLWCAGSKLGNDRQWHAAVWNGSSPTPHWTLLGESGKGAEAHGICFIRNSASTIRVFTCGHINNASGIPNATIWRNDMSLFTLSNLESHAYDITYYNGDIYTVGVEKNNGTGNFVTKVWRNATVLHTLTQPSHNSAGLRIKVDGGDVYVIGWEDNEQKVWKNGTVLYSLSQGNKELHSIDVTSGGIYFGTDIVYKDNAPLYATAGCERVNDLMVKEECLSQEARTLPYFEGFEMGATDWECWVKADEGVNYSANGNYEFGCYWHRSGEGDGTLPQPATGLHCAYHEWNSNYNQEGWLVSPKLLLQPDSDSTFLSFQTRERLSPCTYEGVLISTSDMSPESFTVLWEQKDYAASNVWKTVKLDLTEYQGNEIYLAFKYGGQLGHGWYLDDVLVEEYLTNSTPEPTPATRSLYPNPAAESLHIEGLQKECEILIYNTLGILVSRSTAQPGQEIDLRHLAPGLYLLRCGNNLLQFVKQ